MARKFIKSDKPALDVYQTVTDTIIAALEAGTKPWVKGWAATGGLQLRTGGESYQGVNQFLLALQAAAGGYTSPFWVTYKQAEADKLQVRKGEKGTLVVYSSKINVKDETASDGVKSIFILKHYKVFNVDQCDPMAPAVSKPAKYDRETIKGRQLDPQLLDVDAEMALRGSGAAIRFGGDRAFYSPMADYVQLPEYGAFKSPGAYLATMAHELVHWTGHQSREARKFGLLFGNPDYAREELVAELGSAMTCARLGVAGGHIDSHASYLASWLKVLKSDKRAIIQAASMAQKATDRILGKVDAVELAEDEQQAA